MSECKHTAERSRPSTHRREKGAAKMARIPIKIVPRSERLPKPSWIRVKLPTGPAVQRVKDMLRQNRLYTVCEEASCPNLPECFGHGTATFMIMGDLCTRRCPFCDVAHGRPLPLDLNEPASLAQTVSAMRLRYVVITSVDRDDLRDGGAGHFAQCVHAVRARNPGIRIEILVPDFRGRMERALEILEQEPPDVFNHNLETVPRLYKQARPGADYQWSLRLIQQFKQRHPEIPTKSGLMLGLGEELEEVTQVMRELRAHDCDMLTLGQYLAPSVHHLPVERYVTPDEFDELRRVGLEMGYANIASGPLVRSSYHADRQAAGVVSS
jgi:lipoic acid synthetase